MMQPDNNLVLYCVHGETQIFKTGCKDQDKLGSSPYGFFSGWASNTYNKGRTGTGCLNLQDDGNLVIYDETKTVLWNNGFVFNIII